MNQNPWPGITYEEIFIFISSFIYFFFDALAPTVSPMHLREKSGTCCFMAPQGELTLKYPGMLIEIKLLY